MGPARQIVFPFSEFSLRLLNSYFGDIYCMGPHIVRCVSTGITCLEIIYGTQKGSEIYRRFVTALMATHVAGSLHLSQAGAGKQQQQHASFD